AHRSAPRHYSDVVCDAIASTPGLSRGPEVWDLYGGAGVFAAAALDVAPGARVTLVESATASLGAADTGGQDVDGVRRVGSRVETFLEGGRPGGADTGPDVVVLDPPRGGAGSDGMGRLSELTRARILHVGSDPASLDQDGGAWTGCGAAVRASRRSGRGCGAAGRRPDPTWWSWTRPGEARGSTSWCGCPN